MTDKNGVSIGDKLLVAHEINKEFYMTFGTVLSIEEMIDDDKFPFVIYKIQLAMGDIIKIDEVNAIGVLVKSVPYFLVRYLAMDFDDYEETGGVATAFEPENKQVNKNLPSVVPSKDKAIDGYPAYTIDELLDAYNLLNKIKIKGYKCHIKDIVKEFKKRGGR